MGEIAYLAHIVGGLRNAVLGQLPEPCAFRAALSTNGKPTGRVLLSHARQSIRTATAREG